VGKLFDRIVFNFPHSEFGSFDPRSNRRLVGRFFNSAKHFLSDQGQLHVTLNVNLGMDNRTDNQFDSWQIKQQAERAGVMNIARHKFVRRAYPGYTIRNLQGRMLVSHDEANTYGFVEKNDVEMDYETEGIDDVELDFLL